MATGADPGFAAGLVGVTLDERYRLDALLGEGGMGAVYRATHLAMERKVAVKLLKPHLTGDHAHTQRFLREARSTFKVASPHAVKVLDFGVTPHRDYYMVLEYLDGRTVQRELEIDGPFTPARAVHVARQALHALAAAHRMGLVHRDIKPDNLLLMQAGDDPDYTKVLDFGVAKVMEGASTSDASKLALTAVGMVFGTPEFMSPEQACGHALDARSDLYSLAATLFVMMTGMALFEAGSPIEWLMHHARTPAPRLAMVRHELAAYPALDDLLQRCLAKHRDARPASAEELERLLAGLAPTLAAAVPAAPRTPGSARGAASSYVAALPPETLADVAAASTASLPGTEAATTTGVLREVRGSRRWLGLGAVAAAALLATAIGVGLGGRTRASRSTSIPDAALAAPPHDARAVLADAARAVIPLPVDAAVPDAAVPDAAVPRPARRENPIVDAHLANAAAALRAGNTLRAIAEADLAHRAEPRNVRARQLLGEALIRSGSTARGCRYLREIRRAHSACSDD